MSGFLSEFGRAIALGFAEGMIEAVNEHRYNGNYGPPIQARDTRRLPGPTTAQVIEHYGETPIADSMVCLAGQLLETADEIRDREPLPIFWHRKHAKRWMRAVSEAMECLGEMGT